MDDLTDAQIEAMADKCPGITRHSYILGAEIDVARLQHIEDAALLALGMFGDDGEGLRKAKGDIAHALKVAAKYNQNGPGCSALLAKIGGGRG